MYVCDLAQYSQVLLIGLELSQNGPAFMFQVPRRRFRIMDRRMLWPVQWYEVTDYPLYPVLLTHVQIDRGDCC
jgi:hypothetical protein